MRKENRTALCLALALLLVAPFAAGAEDLTVVTKVVPPKGKPTTSTQYFSSSKIRTSDGNLDTIVDLESGRIVSVDHKKKSYYETSFEEIRAFFAQLETMLESNPMLEKMFGQATAAQVQETGEKRTIAGYECRKLIVTMGEKMSFEVWATSEIKVPLEYYDAQKMLYATMGPMASRFEKMYDALKKIGGFTLATTIDSKVMGMQIHSESEAIEVKKGALPADAFEVPAGYKKKKSPYNK